MKNRKTFISRNACLIFSLVLTLSFLLASCSGDKKLSNNTAQNIGETDYVIALSKKQRADKKENERKIEELKKNTSIECSILAEKENCLKILTEIANDQAISLALKKISEAGVPIMISWEAGHEGKPLVVYEGRFLISEKATTPDIKKFLGLK